ncbi:hypothetical protein AR158_c609R [Paramecium bursaria Chlorella virus AR158]|uniref:hypothetical protein n=1 Tax=Paramecium bursaria Chlorella virus AR158 TaxID=380598 RepID=UPI00015AA7CA|nr:hypothetical protein AR158_c609R [Paramecium bursaria Chlorella virus AR158]ABU44154.1 hypothetical protein AR158_c609R [Paramecium bursaria Chlorella virus AR158]
MVCQSTEFRLEENASHQYHSVYLREHSLFFQPLSYRCLANTRLISHFFETNRAYRCYIRYSKETIVLQYPYRFAWYP